MSDNEMTLTVEKRTIEGKAVKKLRRDGFVPAVIHDHGKPSKVVMAPYLDITRVYQKAGKHHPLELTLGKETYLALIKDIDVDPKKHQLQHVVFNAIKQNETVEADIPVRLNGEIPAEKTGHMVITHLDHVQVEALPGDLPDELTVSAETLSDIGDKVTVADITAPKGVTILTDLEHSIASVEETKAQISEEAEEAEGEEGTEGEVNADGEDKEASEEE